MTITDRLARLLDDEDAAATVLDHLADLDLTLEIDDLTPLPHGYTGARLLVVVLAHATGRKRPFRCIAKLCPPDEYRPSHEGQRHYATLHDSPDRFVRAHLTKIVFGPVPCPTGAQVIGQEIAGGSVASHRPLSKVDGAALARACDTIRRGLLRDWAANDYDRQVGTLAKLLELELRDSIRPSGWLWKWAEHRALLDPACEWIEVAPDGVLRNPFRLLLPASAAASRDLAYLTGRCHGDLHADNVLVPHADGAPHTGRFRLIDLATFDPQAPLSRDIATLTISLIARRAGQLDPADQDGLLRYMISDAPTSVVAVARAPTSLTKIVRALCTPKGTFIDEQGWLDDWAVQVRVSCLAQALLHATYGSVSQDGRWWCFRLAARLAQELLPGQAPGGGQSLQLGPEICADEPSTLPADPVAPPRAHAQRRDPRFVDREEQRVRLRAALQDDVSPVILVTGPAGVGKTQLVEEVLAELGWDTVETTGRRVCRHDAAPGTRLDMKALIDDIEHGEAPANLYLYGPASRARMQAALDGYTGLPVVIIVESAECLLDDAQSLRDPDLDEALEMLSARSRSPAKVVLVSEEVPRADGAVTWPATAHPISLSGLAAADFRRFLGKLDPAAEWGLATLALAPFAQVHSRLRGNPRLAELLHALISWADRDLGAEDVPAWLAAGPEEEVPQRLTDELIRGLPGGHQRVIEALAAFGTPVDESTVGALLEPFVSRARVREALRTLVRRRIARMTCDQQRYHLPRSDVDRILAHLPSGDPYEEADSGPTRRNLLHRAARVLDSLLKDDDDVRSVSDLYPHFARLDVLVRAAMYGEAHEVILAMDRLLRRWNQGGLLREPRESVRGMLDDLYAEMENHAALGDVYSSLGLLAQAHNSYQAALSLAQSHHSLEDLRRIYINMGQMYKEHNDFGKAHGHFDYGLAIAQEEGEEADGDRMAALEGLADCARASGRFAEAIRLGEAALAIAEPAESPRTVDIALKLSRWFADVDRMKDAAGMLALAEVSAGYDDMSARAACLDAAADLVFRRGGAVTGIGADAYLDEAAREAQQAVDLALAQRDPDTLRQARTTLCAVHLHRDDVPAARREIEAAVRHRREGHSLLVVALRSLVAWRGRDSRMAAELFGQLRREAQLRVDADGQDFAARDMLGLALCAEALADGTSLAPAAEAFRTARGDSEPAPGLVRQLRFLVEQLVRGGSQQEPQVINPVLGAITEG